MQSMISIVFIQYNNKKEILSHIQNITSNNVKIYVVINDREKWNHPNIKFLNPKKNIGYLPAFQKCIRYFNIEGTVILSNTDVKFEKNFFKKLKRYKWPKNIETPNISTNLGKDQTLI